MAKNWHNCEYCGVKMRSKSKRPGKQRISQFNIGKHEVHKVMSANLSRELRERQGFRSLPLRKDDEVRIVRGDAKGRSGKVIRVDPRKQRIFVDKVVKRKTDNTEIAVPIHPSNVVITKYVVTKRDERRVNIINRRTKDVEEQIDIASLPDDEEIVDDIIDFDDDELLDSAVDDESEEFDLLEDEETSDDQKTKEASDVEEKVKTKEKTGDDDEEDDN